MFRLLSCLVLALVYSSISAQPPPSLELSPEEKKLVIDLASHSLKGMVKSGKVYLTQMEVFRDTRDRASPRNVLVSHYCYEGDLTLFTSINLGRKQVTKVEAIPHCPTSLAPEELAFAEKLARTHAEVQKALARHGKVDEFQIDALVAHTADPKAPTYRHRVVHIFFRQGRTYLLYGPRVEVDLTTETVRVFAQDDSHK